ncbi:tetraacyldisaccharide 4'-kinase [Candidatus Palibaumannia cicadellinicola]|uniref:tetraacyldisaccharide 4'-kinase n=1 Tax=Candidatus Palibaumannia cicadellinicola TaxID=186490 RepID=UPI000ADC02AA|nr:tetraacyldisaccharide 4'-kinase [Candidatus Baumannia cicadellinicola]
MLLPLSWLYGLVSNLIHFSYRYGRCQKHRLFIPVVVVSNRNAGGNRLGNGKISVVL